MKIAIVHDWLVIDGGAEKVLRAIIDIYPNADIFSLVDFLSNKERINILDGKYAKTSFIQKLPFAKRYFRYYLPLFPKAIESLDLTIYDLIIGSSWAVAKGIQKSKDQIHICYCHTPIRYAWDLYDEYTNNLKQPKKFLVQKSLKYIKNWDLATVDRVDYFIANSNFVAKRIKKNYNRDSIVIYPPVDTSNFKLYQEKEEFYLCASRLVPYKKTKLIVEAFNEMPNKILVVIGIGEEYKDIKKIAQDNIKLSLKFGTGALTPDVSEAEAITSDKFYKSIRVLGYQEKENLIDYMQKAKGFVYSAIEDFGIVPIEALSCGTPVIALNKGGTAETIKDKFNGIHFEKQSKKDIIDAIKKFENYSFDYKKISLDTQKYSTKRFKKEFEEFINSKLI